MTLRVHVALTIQSSCCSIRSVAYAGGSTTNRDGARRRSKSTSRDGRGTTHLSPIQLNAPRNSFSPSLTSVEEDKEVKKLVIQLRSCQKTIINTENSLNLKILNIETVKKLLQQYFINRPLTFD